MKKLISMALTLTMLFASIVPAYAESANLSDSYFEFGFDASDWTFSFENLSANADKGTVTCSTFDPATATYNSAVLTGDYVLAIGITNNGSGSGNKVFLNVGRLSLAFAGDKAIYYGDNKIGTYGSNGANANIAVAYSASGTFKVYRIDNGSLTLVYEETSDKLKDLSNGDFSVKFNWASGSFHSLKMFKPYGDEFEDDFSGELDSWKFSDGAYSVQDGKLASAQDDIAYVKTVASGKYSVSVDLQQGDGDVNYIYFNSITDSDFYALKVSGENISLVKGAQEDELASFSAAETVSNVRMDFSNENDADIDVYLNGEEQPSISTSDTSYCMGRVGLKLGMQSTADNFALEVIDNSPEGRLKKDIKLFNKNKTVEKLRNIADEHYELLGIDINDLNALPQETQDDIFTRSFAELDGKTTEKEISNAIISKIAFELLSETGDLNVLSKYQSYMEFSDENYYDDWENLSDEEKSQICLKLKGSADLNAMMKTLESNVIIKALTATSWSGMKDKLGFYAENISLDLTKVEALSQEAQKMVFSSFKTSLENGTLSDIVDINKTLSDLADTYKNYGESSGSGSSGGSGGGRGKKTGSSGGTSFSAPVEITDNKATEIPNLPFADVEDIDWALTPIVKLWQDGIINGRSEKEFAPFDDVTREEFVAIIARALNLSAKEGLDKFSDVSADRWSAKAIAAACENGIVNGVGNGNFAPQAKITRQDMALIIYNAAKMQNAELKSDAALSFSDKDSVADYAKDAVAALSNAKILNGESGRFNPLDNANRAQTAAVIYRLLEIINK